MLCKSEDLGRAYSEVETGKVEKPSICIPCPASNGTVHNCCPAESENHGRHDATTFERSTNDELYSNSAEEHLVKTEDDLRKKGGARRRGRHDILQAKVFHIANERAGRPRVGQRITPEEPLEAYTCLDQSKLDW